jgi:hypothetical protein
MKLWIKSHSCGGITGFDLGKGVPDDDAWCRYRPFGPRPLLYPRSTTLLRCRVLPGYTAAYEQTPSTCLVVRWP